MAQWFLQPIFKLELNKRGEKEGDIPAETHLAVYCLPLTLGRRNHPTIENYHFRPLDQVSRTSELHANLEGLMHCRRLSQPKKSISCSLEPQTFRFES